MISNDPFAVYGHQQTKPQRPAPLQGPIKTRAAARVRYAEIVSEIACCEDADTLTGFLSSIDDEVAQFRDELEFYWEGDGDFAGLSNEIERAKARCSEGDLASDDAWLRSHASAEPDGDTGAYTGNWS